jgi:hypothetical protein
MSIPKKIEEEFEAVKRRDIDEYESKLTAAREATTRMKERSKVITKRLRDVAKKNKIDLAVLHSVHNDEDEYFSRYLEEIRPKLMDRPSQVQSDLRIKAKYAPILDGDGYDRAEILGSLLLAPDTSLFEGMEGERGNPWLAPKPESSARVHIGQKYTGAGTGSGCWGIGYIYSPYTAHVYFYYTPTKTGTLNIQAWTVLHGFYIAYADDGCFTCKMAKVYATMWISTYQFQQTYWIKGDEYKICDIDDDNVNTYATVDEGIHLYATQLALSGAPVVIRVSIAVGTLAKGSGSHAEVDFKSKAKNGSELNYIWIPCVVVSYK